MVLFRPEDPKYSCEKLPVKVLLISLSFLLIHPINITEKLGSEHLSRLAFVFFLVKTKA